MVAEKLRTIIEDISRSQSVKFTDTICLALAKAISADFVFIAYISEDCSEATTISLASNGKILKNFTYHLEGTPCADVNDDRVCSFSKDIQQLYPNDQLLADMGIEGYMGIPLDTFDAGKRAILVSLYREEVQHIEDTKTLFLLFSGMISKELENQWMIQDLSLTKRIIDESREAVVICDHNNQITSVNKAFTEISGYKEAEVIGKNPSILSANKHSKRFYEKMWQKIQSEHGWSGEVINQRKNGEEFPEWLSISAMTNDKGVVTHYVAFFIDITEQKKAEEQIYIQANYDLLTGLSNRYRLIEKINEIVVDEARGATPALVFIDLDLFKEVNDTFGHDFGDQLLIKFGQLLSATVPDGTEVARISGDSFALLLPDTSSKECVVDLMSLINTKLSEPFHIDQQHLRVTISAGCCMASSAVTDVNLLIKRAELALYHAKDKTQNTFSFYTDKMHQAVERKVALKNALKTAIETESVFLQFQPIVDCQTEKVVKFEALVRWCHDGVNVSPAEFIPIAEEYGLITRLGDVVLKQAAQLLKQVKLAGFNDIVFSVNRSVYEIPLDEIDNDVWLDQIRSHGLKPADICFELTESALASNKRNNAVLLRHLQTAGCSIALDDFGTGYSSLCYLRQFPVDIIKIDRSFVVDMDNDDAKALVAAIIAMARALGKTTVAEGVETREQLKQLCRLGCNLIQGYYYSKPLNAGDVIPYLSEYSA